MMKQLDEEREMEGGFTRAETRPIKRIARVRLSTITEVRTSLLIGFYVFRYIKFLFCPCLRGVSVTNVISAKTIFEVECLFGDITAFCTEVGIA